MITSVAPDVGTGAGADLPLEERYLELVKACLTRMAFAHPEMQPVPCRSGWRGVFDRIARAWMDPDPPARLAHLVPFDPARRGEGMDWPADAETMIGMRRLDNLHWCIRDVIRRRIPGDLIETGVWRGGSTIFMRAALQAYGDTERCVWVADSFQGLPKPDEASYPADRGDRFWTYPELAVSLEAVKKNFAKYGLLDDRVKFLEGWFKDTLPTAPITRLAVLRLDGDMYESTIQALDSLYPRLSPGGYVIVDDYGAVEGCRLAVGDYRRTHGIASPIREIDFTGVFWEKETGQ